MKKKMVLLSMTSLLLMACGNETSEVSEETNSSSSSTNEDAGQGVSETSDTEEINEEEPVDENLVEEGPLLEEGQYTDNSDGLTRLLKIVEPEETFEVSENVFLDIESVKLLHFEEISTSAFDDLSWYYGFEDNNGYGLQFIYSVRNETDQTVNGLSFNRLVLSNGEQVERSSFTESEPYEVLPNAKVSDALGLFGIDDPEITGFTIHPHLYDGDGYDISSNPVEISFE